ncbi:MAG: hypothetical protein ACXWDO_10960, partial [Bacteroidia bacterium]
MCSLNINKQFSSFLFISCIGVVLYFSLSAYKLQSKNATSEVKELYIKDVNNFHEAAHNLTKTLQLLEQNQTSIQSAKTAFYSVKQAYKRIEYLLEYLDPELAKNLNGAPLPKVVVDEANYLRLGHIEPAFVVLQPEGLQVIEEIIFAEETNKEDIKEALSLAYKIEEKSVYFASSLANQSISNKQIFESVREQLVRVMAMGITGFDAPASGNEIENVALSLQPIKEIIQILKNESTGENKQLFVNTDNHLITAINYLQQNTNFESFDRLYFIREFANPVYKNLTLLQSSYIGSTKNASVIKPLNDKALNIFSEDFLLS